MPSSREPEDVRGAIAIGLGLYEEGKYQEALDVFEKGLKLPGTGVKRYRSVDNRAQFNTSLYQKHS